MTYHPEAARRYDQKAQEILRDIQAFTNIRVAPVAARRPDLHVSHVFTPDQIISTPAYRFEQNEIGDPCGVMWMSQGTYVGWRGEPFERIRDLAQSLKLKGPSRDLVSDEFALDVTCVWLIDTLERRRSDSLPGYFVEVCANAIREYEIWIPLFRTYSASEFRIGAVTFRSISKGLMDEWQSRIPESPHKSEVEAFINRKRAIWQGALAACTRIQAERQRASQLARSLTKNSTALLSFVSPANQNSRLTNFGTLLGSEVLGSITELTIESGTISTVQVAVNDQRDADWHVDRALRDHWWLFTALDELASNHSGDFRKHLYDALILYSRQAHASELSDKLVFALSALESMFLRDANEPIQKNLGERMAFLTGKSVEERKAIVRNVAEVYKVRSAFVHHGASPTHQHALDQFLTTTWKTFAELLRLRDTYETITALLGVLEDRKMS